MALTNSRTFPAKVKVVYNSVMPKNSNLIKSGSKTKKQASKKLHEEIIGQMLTLATSGFGLVAALAWNETIQKLVKDYIEPRVPGSGLLSQFIYALTITVLAVFVTYQLSHLAAKFHRK